MVMAVVELVTLDGTGKVGAGFGGPLRLVGRDDKTGCRPARQMARSRFRYGENMNVSVASRAHRTIAKLSSYVSLYGEQHPQPEFSRQFGQVVGLYKNPGPDSAEIWILERGLAWEAEGRQFFVPFDRIERAALPDGKESAAVSLQTKGGDLLVLPVRGGNGRFRDAMEMFHFVNRVVDDVGVRSGTP